MAFDKTRVVRQPLGRPSSYRVEYAQQLVNFFENAAIDEYEDREVDGQMTKVLVRKGFFPTLARFATMCGVDQNTLRNWANAKDMDDTPLHPEFFRAYSLAQSLQEVVLAEGYTSGQWVNPGFGALIAKNLTTWKDKQEIESQVTQTVAMTTQQRVEIDFSDIVAEAKQADE